MRAASFSAWWRAAAGFAAEHGADSQIEVRGRAESPEGGPGEAEPVRAAGVEGALGQIRAKQWCVQAQPGQRDEAHRDRYVIVIHGGDESSRAVGDSAEHAEQTELVGGALVVVQDDVAQQRQRTRAVVGQANRQLRPADVLAAQVVIRFDLALHERAVVARQDSDLFGRDGMEPACRLRRAAPERHGQHAARFEQRDQLAEGPRPIGRSDVHPYRAGEYQVEGETGPEGPLETGQGVREPLYGRVVVTLPRDGSEAGGRFHRDDVITLSREPRGVSAAAGADIECGGRGRRKQFLQPVVNAIRGHGLVAVRQLVGVGVVPRGRVRHGVRSLATTVPAAPPSRRASAASAATRCRCAAP